MNCPGSVALLKALKLPETDEPDYRKNGIAAHEAAAKCLIEDRDAWEVVGEKFHDTAVDIEIADAVQVYLDVARSDVTPGCEVFTELKLSAPLHKDMFGTLDRAVVNETESWMIVTDYKHGEGIQVDVQDNPQLKYYAFMLLLEFPHIRNVRLRIVQPRGFHPEGPVREWPSDGTWVNSDDIVQWAEDELLPAMRATEVDNSLDSGPWCRFCPAKLICPMLSSLFQAACLANVQHIPQISNASLGRSYQYLEAVEFYVKAFKEETLRRGMLGQDVPGTKLVQKRANRVWKPEAKDHFIAKWPTEAMTVPALKSPAEMEKIGAEAKKLVHEYAYTPQTGLTVALERDKRVGVKVQTTQEAFGGAIDKLIAEEAKP